MDDLLPCVGAGGAQVRAPTLHQRTPAVARELGAQQGHEERRAGVPPRRGARRRHRGAWHPRTERRGAPVSEHVRLALEVGRPRCGRRWRPRRPREAAEVPVVGAGRQREAPLRVGARRGGMQRIAAHIRREQVPRERGLQDGAQGVDGREVRAQREHLEERQGQHHKHGRGRRGGQLGERGAQQRNEQGGGLAQRRGQPTRRARTRDVAGRERRRGRRGRVLPKCVQRLCAGARVDTRVGRRAVRCERACIQGRVWMRKFQQGADHAHAQLGPLGLEEHGGPGHLGEGHGAVAAQDELREVVQEGRRWLDAQGPRVQRVACARVGVHPLHALAQKVGGGERLVAVQGGEAQVRTRLVRLVHGAAAVPVRRGEAPCLALQRAPCIVHRDLRVEGVDVALRQAREPFRAGAPHT